MSCEPAFKKTFNKFDSFVKLRLNKMLVSLAHYGVLSAILSYLLIIALSFNFQKSQVAWGQVSNPNNLLAPANIRVEEDDNNAVLSWGEPITPGQPNPPGVMGYRISWGLAGSSAAPTVQLTAERTIQLQPLVNGQPYQATIQSVDSLGNLSAPSPSVTFSGNGDRVKALRERMSGFFDDFNQPAGALDELKWNQAFSACDDPALSASFINTQYHAHDMVLSTCDRAQVVNRPRAVFDFSGRTGTVAFDMDGAVSRSFWYLDFIDAAYGPIDITSHVSEFGGESGTPGNVFRVRQNGSGLSFQYADATGTLTTFAETNWNPYPPLDWAGFKTIPNLRRHWELHISQQKAEVTINGKVVLAAALNLPFSRATVHWDAFSYNTTKNNVPYSLIHWDNFGFDGPSPTVVTHNYRAAGYAGRDFLIASNNIPVSTQLNIPDSLAGAKAQRLMFTLQMRDYSSYQWSVTDRVVVNGRAIAVPKPVIVNNSGIDNIRPYSVSLDLPQGTLKTGINQLDFIMLNSQLLNIHAELNFSKSGVIPAFTQPVNIYSGQMSQVMPTMPEVGPAVIIQKVGDAFATDGGRYSTKINPVSGTIPVSFDIDHSLAMSAMGKNPGIAKVQVRINKSVVQEWNFPNPVPATSLIYNLDSTKYSNGQYELDVVAFNPSGAISIPNYFEARAKAGDYYPVYLNINNSTTVPTVTATASPTPTLPPTGTPGSGTGLKGLYFTNKNLSGKPALQKVDATINFNWGTASPAPGIPSDYFSIQWTGQVMTLSAGTYTFCSQSDDGARLWINDVQVVNNWAAKDTTEKCGNISLSGNQLYSLKMEYYEGTGSAVARLLWQGPGIVKQIIPQNQLYPLA